MQIQFIAQSGFIIKTKNRTFTIDLWLDNPLHPLKLEDVPKTDYVFITHDHGDHDLKTGIELAKRDKSIFISDYTIMKHAQKQGVEDIASGNIGGFYKVDEELEIAIVRADHSSDIGNPVGFLIKIDGITIYHAGDTGYMSEFAKIGKLYNIDLFLVPIGSRYTMDPLQAAHAVKDVKANHVVPIHYNTFPKITQDENEFIELVKKVSPDSKVKILKPGGVLNYEVID